MNADAELLALRLANEALQAQLIADAEQTERMLAELEQQRNLLRDGHREQQSLFRFVQRVMDSVGSLVVVLDAEGRIVRCNRAATEQLAGLDPACGARFRITRLARRTLHHADYSALPLAHPQGDAR